MLYSISNPLTAVTVGSVKAEAQVLLGAVMLGAAGKITTYTASLTPQGSAPTLPADVDPQVAAST